MIRNDEILDRIRENARVNASLESQADLIR